MAYNASSISLSHQRIPVQLFFSPFVQLLVFRCMPNVFNCFKITEHKYIKSCAVVYLPRIYRNIRHISVFVTAGLCHICKVFFALPYGTLRTILKITTRSILGLILSEQYKSSIISYICVKSTVLSIFLNKCSDSTNSSILNISDCSLFSLPFTIIFHHHFYFTVNTQTTRLFAGPFSTS